MSQGDGSSKTGDAGVETSAAALRAQYRATRARLLGSPQLAKVPPLAPAARAAMRRQRARRSRRRGPRWLGELIAFNEELRRLFLGGGTTAAIVTGEQIRAVVAEHFGLTLAEIAGGRAVRRVARPRQIAMYICARHAALSSPSIARLFGNHDHSTVLYALRAVATRLKKDPGLEREIARLIEKCRRGGPA